MISALNRLVDLVEEHLSEEIDVNGWAGVLGYGSAEAFGRAFRAVHGASPGEVRRDGSPPRCRHRRYPGT